MRTLTRTLLTLGLLVSAALVQGCSSLAPTPTSAADARSFATVAASGSHAVVDCAITEWNGRCP